MKKNTSEEMLANTDEEMEILPADKKLDEAVEVDAPKVEIKEPEKDRNIDKPAPKKGEVVVRSGREIAPLIPTTIQEAWLFCSQMAKSWALPQVFYQKPKALPEGQNWSAQEVATARAFQALQLGMEVGLPPAQAIQSILVQNGVGTIWGDAQLALVLNSGKAKYVKEYESEGEMFDAKGAYNPAYTWICETLRVGDEQPTFTRFSIADAVRAGIWGARTWATHPGRMGKYKARAFCLRDKYPDVLKGLVHSTEEMQGEMINVTPNADIVPLNPAERLGEILTKKGE